MQLQLIGLILLSFGFSTTASSSISTSASSSDSPPTSLNLLDLLSQSSNHTILVRLFQRTRLIPTLNKLQFNALQDHHGITILAPTDHAIRQRADRDQQSRLQRQLERSSDGEKQVKEAPQGFTAEYLELPQFQSSSTHQDSSTSDDQRFSVWEWALKLVEGDSQDQDSMRLIWRPSDSSSSAIGIHSSPPITQDHENIHALLRQELLYHIFNFTLPFNSTSFSPSDSNSDSDLLISEISKPPQMISTLHLPSRKLLTDPTRPGDDPHPYPPGSPEIPHPGDEDRGGLLGGEGQKLRYSWKSDMNGKEDSDGEQEERIEKDETTSLYFGVDSRGKGGIKTSEDGIIVSQLYGKIVSLEGVLELPPPLETLIKSHPSLSQLSTLLSHLPDLLSTFSTSAHLTLFLPTSESFKSDLSRLEFDYLNGDWNLSNQDKLKFLAWHSSSRGLGNGKIGYSERIREELEGADGLEMTTILGGKVRLEDDQGRIKIFSIDLDDSSSTSKGPSHLVSEDLLAENGVVHIVSNLLLPEKDLELNVEKTLLALNASHFVNLIHQAGLESYINAELKPPTDGDGDGTELPSYTFFVPKDDAIEDWLTSKEQELGLHTFTSVYPNRQSSSLSSRFNSILKFDPQFVSDSDFEFGTIPKKGSRELEDLMRYHIAPSQLKKENLSDAMLIGTELRDWRLKQGRQRIKVEVGEKGLDYGYGARKGKGDDQVEIGVGDANVLAEPVIVGNSIIYIISQLLTPPANPIQVAVSTLSLSTFVAACSVSDLTSTLKRAPGVTLLIPHNEAFNSLGLVMPYLLLDEAEPRNELKSLVEYHAIDKVVYREDFELIDQSNNTGGREYPTLEGSDIWAGKLKNGSIEVRKGGSGAIGRNSKVLKADRLTATGVIQEIDSVEIPPTLDLTIGKLMRGAKASTMASLIRKAGYEYILNGTLPQDEETQVLDDELQLLRAGGIGGHKKKRRNSKKDHKKRHKMFKDLSQAYVVLTPTDQAFTRINLSYYLEDKQALKELVQLHIIPSPADEVLRDGNGNENLLPINIKDEKVLTSLLDRNLGGGSKFGKLAIRKDAEKNGLRKNDGDRKGDEDEDEKLGWIIGIANSRGSNSRNHAANVITFGRESPATLTTDDYSKLSLNGSFTIEKKDRRGKVPLPGEEWNSRNVGGILTLDSVLEPYEPNWFFRWGYVVLYVLAAAIVMAGLGFSLWTWRNRSGRIRLTEAMDGEEE